MARRKYAEIMNGFVVDKIQRPDGDGLVPEFVAPRFAIRIDNLPSEPEIGWEYDGINFFPPTRPNPNLIPPPPTDRDLLEEIRADISSILALLTPGPP